MDSLKSLMDKKQYDLVIKLTEKSESVNDLFYRISALLALGRGEEALSCLKSHQKLLQSRLSVLIKIHIELLCLLGDFDKAFEELNYYESLPYESQEVEELLHKMPKYIREEEKKLYTTSKFDDAKLIQLLSSPVIEEVVPALDIIKERDISVFLPKLEDMLMNYPVQSVRSFVLLVLLQKGVDKELDFNSNGKTIKVNPSKLEAPFTGKEFNFFVRKMEIEFKNASLLETALTMHASYCISQYPNTENCYSEAMIVALYEITCRYMKMPPEVSLVERCEAKNLDVQEVRYLIQDIDEALENF